jgi:hypothetical protein
MVHLSLGSFPVGESLGRIPRRISLFLRNGNSPAIILRPPPVLARRYLLHCLIHPRTRGHDVVAQTRQDGAENCRVLHAVAATSHATLDDLVEEVHRIEADGMGGE